MEGPPRPFWSPYVAGVVLGLVLLATFLVTGHGLGASGFFTRVTTLLGQMVAPESTLANPYLGPYAQGNPLPAWITWEVLGVVLGGGVSSSISGRFRLGIEKGEGTPSLRRLAFALLGGGLVGIGSRFARGCTSGLGLSGGATLAVAAFVFLMAFFGAGFLVTFLRRRAWV